MLVSIVIPTYNRAQTIERSVGSVLNQTYRDIEVIVVDDCSTDNTEEVINKIRVCDSRVRYYKLEANSGACQARNMGIDKAKGDFIAFQDSDDEWLPLKLEEQLHAMKENSALVSFCQLNKIYSETESYYFPIMKSGYVCRNDLLSDSIVSTQTLIAAKKCFEGIRFDPDMPRLQDYDISIRLSDKYDFFYVNKPLVNMYLQKDSITNDWGKMIAALERIQKKYTVLMSEYKGMKFYVYRMIYKANKRSGEKSMLDAWRCFITFPLKTILLFKKSLFKKSLFKR